MASSSTLTENTLTNKTVVGDEHTSGPTPPSWADWKQVPLPEVDLNSEEVLGGEESDEAISTEGEEDSGESSDDEEDEEDALNIDDEDDDNDEDYIPKESSKALPPAQPLDPLDKGKRKAESDSEDSVTMGTKRSAKAPLSAEDILLRASKKLKVTSHDVGHSLPMPLFPVGPSDEAMAQLKAQREKELAERTAEGSTTQD